MYGAVWSWHETFVPFTTRTKGTDLRSQHIHSVTSRLLDKFYRARHPPFWILGTRESDHPWQILYFQSEIWSGYCGNSCWGIN